MSEADEQPRKKAGRPSVAPGEPIRRISTTVPRSIHERIKRKGVPAEIVRALLLREFGDKKR